VNRYLLEEKLPRDIEHARQSIEEGKRIVGMRNVTREYIDELQTKVSQLNAELASMTREREDRERADAEAAASNEEEESFTIYRHQYANIQRRKASVADSLQSSRRQLDSLESELDRRRRELAERNGGSAEVVSSVQYKLYLNKLRTKNNSYKKMKAELEELRAEIQILERTIEVLDQRFSEVKEQNVRFYKVHKSFDF